MARIKFLSVMTMALFIAACTFPLPRVQDTSTPASAQPVELGDTWTIKMTQSGGIMGLRRSVEISSDGKYTVTDERMNKSVSGVLPTNELTTLTRTVSALRMDLQTPEQSVCADCFIYEIEIQSNDETISLQLDDITLPDSGMEPLISSLITIMNTALK